MCPAVGIRARISPDEFRQHLACFARAAPIAAAAYSKVTADKAATKDQKDAAYKKWVEAYDAYKKEAGDPYHALPEEADAWAVAGKMKAAYIKK